MLPRLFSLIVGCVAFSAHAEPSNVVKEIARRFDAAKTHDERRAILIEAMDHELVKMGAPLSRCEAMFGKFLTVHEQATKGEFGMAIVYCEHHEPIDNTTQGPDIGWYLVLRFNEQKIITDYFLTNLNSKG
jgi:hypothetical protein